MINEKCITCRTRLIKEDLFFLTETMVVLDTTKIMIEYIESDKNSILRDDTSNLNQALLALNSVVDKLEKIAAVPWKDHCASIHKVAEEYAGGE
tara:strand:- start:1294 stop:1575 length:282 start_codon:yes stop_codon:yes gene_type:complete